MRNLGKSDSNRLHFMLAILLGLLALVSVSLMIENRSSEKTLLSGTTTIYDKLAETERSHAAKVEGGAGTNINVQKSLGILATASSAGRFVHSPTHGNITSYGEELNWTDPNSTQFQVPKEWAELTGFSETLVESLHLLAHYVKENNASFHHKTMSNRDQELLSGLRGKTLLMMGDSTTNNIYSTMCHCPRNHNVDPSLQGSMEHDSQTACFSDSGSGCVGPEIMTCQIKALNLTLHTVQGEYAIHPYGKMPYDRGEKPVCTSNLDLSSCLKKKWDASCNMADGLNCMSNSSCPTHRPPDMVLVNINLWFWFRMNWYGSLDEKNFGAMPWGDIEEAYMTNMTTVLHTLAGDYLKRVKMVVVQTVPGSKSSSRIPMPKIMHINSAIRSLSAKLNAIGSNPPVGILELDHMGHMGWDREMFLLDDIHPQFVFNNAVANILFNALSVL